MGNSASLRRENAVVTLERTRLRESVKGKGIPAAALRKGGAGGSGDEGGGGGGGGEEEIAPELNFFANFVSQQSPKEIVEMNDQIEDMLRDQIVNGGPEREKAKEERQEEEETEKEEKKGKEEEEKEEEARHGDVTKGNTGGENSVTSGADGREMSRKNRKGARWRRRNRPSSYEDSLEDDETTGTVT